MSVILHRKREMLWSALGRGWQGPEPVVCSWPICLGLLHARSPCTGKEVSEAAFHATEREKGGGQLVIAMGYKSPEVMLSSGSESWWPRFVSERRHYSQASQPRLALQVCSFILFVPKLFRCTLSRRHKLTKQGQRSQAGRTLQWPSGDPESGPGSTPAGGAPWMSAFAPGLSFPHP